MDHKLKLAESYFEAIKESSTRRLMTSLKYGDDMKSSRLLCVEDHLRILKTYITNIEVLLEDLKKDANYICYFDEK